MRERLTLLMIKILQWAMGLKRAASEAEKEVEERFCPICGEIWMPEDVFCYNCGHEIRDEKLSLYPPPERMGAITDPDRLIEPSVREELAARLDKIGSEKKWDIGILVVPSDLLFRIQASGESLEGFSYNLYNTWQMGKSTGMHGMLLVVNPFDSKRAVVFGREGPYVKEEEFADWYSEFVPCGSEVSGKLAEEISYLAEKIAQMD